MRALPLTLLAAVSLAADGLPQNTLRPYDSYVQITHPDRVVGDECVVFEGKPVFYGIEHFGMMPFIPPPTMRLDVNGELWRDEAITDYLNDRQRILFSHDIQRAIQEEGKVTVYGEVHEHAFTPHLIQIYSNNLSSTYGLDRHTRDHSLL